MIARRTASLAGAHRSAPLLLLFVLVVLLAAPVGLPGGLLGASGSALAPLGLSNGPGPTSSSHAPLAHAALPKLSARPSAAPVCQDTTAGDDAYTSLAGANSVAIFPFYPSIFNQTPCILTALDPNLGGTYNDEVHGSFFSNSAGSGDRFSVPITLPNTPGQGANYSAFINSFYVGMVVTGDSKSASQLSYLSVIFQPQVASSGNVQFVALLSVLSLWSGACGTTVGLEMTVDNHYSCEVELLGSGAGLAMGTSPYPGGDKLSVTFSGGFGSNAPPTWVYVNDSTSSSLSSSYELLASSATSSDTFLPAYLSSCTDLCELNWSMPFGNGFGVNLNANSYSIPLQESLAPIALGAPTFYVAGSGYTGEFSNFSTESATGGCNPQTGAIACSGLGEQNAYPFFQFNGSQMDFGSSVDYGWTTNDMAGIYGSTFSQFSPYGSSSDLLPTWVDELRNSSAAGWETTGVPVTVTMRAQDWGTIASASLLYELPGTSAYATTSMNRVSGTSSDGIYSAQIPASGSTGATYYRVEVLTTAHNLLVRPQVNAFQILDRATLPRFNVTFQMSPDPPGLGAINFNALNYTDHSQITVPAGVYTITAYPVYPYVFRSWSILGVPSNNSGQPRWWMTLNLSADTTVVSNFRYVRPFDTIHVDIGTNGGCGAIVLNRTTYTVNTTVRLLDLGAYPLSYSACALNEFSGYRIDVPTNLSYLGAAGTGTLTLHGNGTVELTFLPQSDPRLVPLVLDTTPAGCGGVLFEGAGYTNNTDLGVETGKSYAIGPDPCANWGLSSFSTSPGLTVNGGALTVNAGGTVTAHYYAETIVTILTYPAFCGSVTFNHRAYYDGAQVVVTNNTAYPVSATPCSGYAFSGFQCLPPIYCEGGSAVLVEGSGNITAVFVKGAVTEFVAFITYPTGCGQIRFAGQLYNGSGYVRVPPGTVSALQAVPCAGYGFTNWQSGGPGIVIVNGTATVNSSGSITAVFERLVGIEISTVPANCGAVTIAGIPYISGQVAELPEFDSFPISTAPCAHDTLLSISTSTGASVSNGLLNVSSPATLTAYFVPITYLVLLDVSPGNCGSIQIAVSGPADQYNNNTTVGIRYGSYTIHAEPCQGFHLVEWNLTGGLAVAQASSTPTMLTVNGSGNLTAVYLPIDPVAVLEAPSSAYVGTTVSLTGGVESPVPSTAHHTYSYRWSFGDGTSVVTPTGFASHTYTVTGTYLLRVTITDPYGRDAAANATISIVAGGGAGLSSFSLSSIGPPAIAVVGIAILVIGITVAVAFRPPKGPEPGASDGRSTPQTSNNSTPLGSESLPSDPSESGSER